MRLKSPILFLDVDGVLNSLKTGGRYALKKKCLRRLQEIVEKTGCEIVLSSTWRKDEYAFKRLRRVLAYRNIKIKDTTPVLHGEIRGEEIRKYMLDRSPEGNTWRYAILDDDGDMLREQLPNFFQTDPEFGITDTIAYRVIYHLTNSEQ